MPKRIKLNSNDNNDEFNLKSKELKSNLQHFENKLIELKHNFLNNHDLVYEECTELKRIVQLNSEETIANIKLLNNIGIDDEESLLDNKTRKKIDNINQLNMVMIERINQFEDSSKKTEIKISTKKKINQEIKRLKLISKFFINYWLLNETNLNFSNISKILLKLESYQLRLDNINVQLKHLVFNNNILDFKQGNLYLKQAINFNNLDQIQLFKLIKDSDTIDCDIQIELFNDESYLIVFKKRSINKTLIFILNSASLTIDKKSSFDNLRIHSLKRINNLIVSVCSNEFYYIRDIVVMNDDLVIINRKQVGSISLLGANEKLVFCFEDFNSSGRSNLCKVFDWNLNEIENDIRFQNMIPGKPFYIPFETINISIKQLEKFDNKYIVKTTSDRSQRSFVIIYDETGAIVKLITVLKIGDGLFKFTSTTNELIISDDNKLIYYNLNGYLTREIGLNGKDKYFKNKFNENAFNFFIDNKSENFHFFNETSIFKKQNKK